MKRNSVMLNYIAILTLFMCTAAGTYENSALQVIMEAWPEVAAANIRMMVTLPSLVSTVTMLIAGKLVGTKLKYRTVTAVGAAAVLAGGLIPFFLAPSWAFVLVCRAVLGFGTGCLSVRNALLSRSVAVEELAKYLGIGAVLQSAVSSSISPIVGALTSFGYRYAFLMNGIAVIPLAMILFFIREPESVQNTVKKGRANPLPGKIWIYILIQFAATLVLYPLLSGMASYMNETGLGNAAAAGFMLSIYTGSGVVVNLFLKKVLGTLGNHSFTLAFSSVVLGSILLIFPMNLITVGTGVFLSGIGFMLLSAYMQVVTGTICDETNVANGSTMILAGTQAGVFLSSYFIEATASLPFFTFPLLNTYCVCMLVYAGLLVINLVFNKYLN